MNKSNVFRHPRAGQGILMDFFTFNPKVFALMYGDYFDLHSRLLNQLKSDVPYTVPIQIWCNVIGNKTLNSIKDMPANFSFNISKDNVPKYKAMRQMFALLKITKNKHNWICWVDDDTHFPERDWFQCTKEAIRAESVKKDVCYVGQSNGFYWHEGQSKFIEASSWYKDKKPYEFPDKRPGIVFASGSYWWLRTDMLVKIDWPDPRLNHNGGDCLLGEAVRQNDGELFCYSYGVHPNDSIRRGLSEPPAGSVKSVCREATL